jgi:hypothetical protein
MCHPAMRLVLGRLPSVPNPCVLKPTSPTPRFNISNLTGQLSPRIEVSGLYGYRRGAGPSGTNRPRRLRY